MWERGYLELRGSDRTFRSNASHHRRGLVTTSGGWVVHVEERLLGASAVAIAYPIERLSRTNRTVLKTAVTGSYAEAIALRENQSRSHLKPDQLGN